MPYLKAYWYYNKEFFVEQQGVELLPDFTKKNFKRSLLDS